MHDELLLLLLLLFVGSETDSAIVVAVETEFEAVVAVVVVVAGIVDVSVRFDDCFGGNVDVEPISLIDGGLNTNHFNKNQNKSFRNLQR